MDEKEDEKESIREVRLTCLSGILICLNKEQLEPDSSYLVDEAEMKYAELHRDHSFKTTFEKKNFLTEILDDVNWKSRLNLN